MKAWLRRYSRSLVPLALVFALVAYALLLMHTIPNLLLRVQAREGWALMRVLLHSLEVSKATEAEMGRLTAEGMLASARLLARLARPSPDLLAYAAHLNHWYEVQVLDSGLRVLASSQGLRRPAVPRDSLEHILAQGGEGLILMGDTLAVVVPAENRRLLVATASVQRLLDLKRRYGLQATLQALGRSPGLRYVAFQSPDGEVRYGVPEALRLRPPSQDPWLLKTLQLGRIRERLTRDPQGHRVLELVAPLEYEGQTGLLRLALSLSVYEQTLWGLIFVGLGLLILAVAVAYLTFRLGRERTRWLAQEESRRQTLEHLPLAVLELDRQGTVTFANSRARLLTGLSPGMPLHRRIPPDLLPLEPCDDLCQGELHWQQRHLAYALLRRPGGWLLVLQDLTPQKLLERRAEEARELESLTRLIGGIVHELRSPLNALAIRIQSLLLGETLSPEHREALQHALEEIRRMEQTVRRVLDLSRPYRLKPEPLRLREFLEEVLAGFRARAKAEGRHWHEDLRIPPEFTLEADPRGLRTALENLLENAFEATGPGDTITVRAYQTPEGRVALEVQDTGRGIPPDLQDRVFEPEFSTKPGGLGLGLHLVRRVAEAHGGRVELRSQPGRGTTVRIFL